MRVNRQSSLQQLLEHSGPPACNVAQQMRNFKDLLGEKESEKDLNFFHTCVSAAKKGNISVQLIQYLQKVPSVEHYIIDLLDYITKPATIVSIVSSSFISYHLFFFLM